MEQHVTVSVKGILVAGVVLLALAVAFLLGRTARRRRAGLAGPGRHGRRRRGRGRRAADADDARRGRGVGRCPTRSRSTSGADGPRRPADRARRLQRGPRAGARPAGRAWASARTTSRRPGCEMTPVYDHVKGQPPCSRGYRVNQSSRSWSSGLGQTGAGHHRHRRRRRQRRAGRRHPAAGRRPGRGAGQGPRRGGRRRDGQGASSTPRPPGRSLGDVQTLVEVEPEDVPERVRRTAGVRTRASRPPTRSARARRSAPAAPTSPSPSRSSGAWADAAGLSASRRRCRPCRGRSWCWRCRAPC